MSYAARSAFVLLSILVGCAGNVRDGTIEDYAPATGIGNDAGVANGGASNGASNGAADAATANGSSGMSTGAASGGSGTSSTGASTGGTTGASTGGVSGGTTGASTGGTTGASTGSTTGSSTGGTTGSSTGSATGAGTGGSTGAPPTDPCANGTEPLTSGLRIREISLYQVVKIPLVTGGTWSTNRPTPVVQGKRALVRVFVDTLSGYSSHTVRGVLTLDNAGAIKRINADVKPTGASSDAALSSTFNFDVSGSDIGPSTKLSVALLETTCPQTLGSATNARFPASGLQSLDATLIKKLRVVVVPIVLGGRSPDTSAQQLENMRTALLAHYPVAGVEVTTRAPVTSSTSVSAGGGGWSDVLNTVIRTRQSDAPASDVYYYGVMAPSSSFSSYCRGGCVLGLAPQTTRVSPSQQAGLGIGFLDEHTPDTMVHELGHAHGRGHAPCAQGGSIDGVDQSFPYSGGGIGVWGWDSRSNTLQNPASVKDVMGYCEPTWISDYTYKGLATRSQQVNTAALVYHPEGLASLDGMLLYENGGARWTGTTTTDPGEELEPADVLDEDGNVIERVHVARVALSHVDDVIVYLPPRQPEWSGIVVADRTIWFDEVQEPL